MRRAVCNGIDVHDLCACSAAAGESRVMVAAVLIPAEGNQCMMFKGFTHPSSFHIQ